MIKINQNWIFGDSAGVSFSISPPDSFNVLNPVGERRFSTWEGCASVSDENGNLLFYTDGSYIWKSNGITIKDGSSDYLLKGDKTSSQSAIIVPDPANNKQYYILTADGNSFGNSSGINYFDGVLINVDTWNVTRVIPNLISTPPPTENLSPAEKITAVRAPNCTDFWVLSAFQKSADENTQLGLGIIQIYKISLSGISFIEQVELNLNISDVGYMKCSHDGKLLAIASHKTNKVYLFPFNNVDGKINIDQLVTLNVVEPYGVEFSPDNNILYISRIGYRKPQNFIYQVDLTQSNLNPTLLETFDRQVGQGRHVIGALQLGPDNKIYIARDQYHKIGVIHKPNIFGIGCDLDIDYIVLDSGKCNLGLPNIVSHICPSVSNGSGCGCSCCDCNKDAESQNKELIERAKRKTEIVKSDETCFEPFFEDCTTKVINEPEALEPCFFMHYDNNESKECAQKIYLTVCNTFTDIQYNNFQLTKITLIPENPNHSKIYIVPDGLVFLDCLKPCSCKTREFVLVNENNNHVIEYKLELEYCYDSITLTSALKGGKVELVTE